MTLTKNETEKIFHSPVFAGIDTALALKIFEKHNCRAVDFEEGDIILSQDEPSRMAGIFLSGGAIVTTADDSKNALLRFFKAGDFFGIGNLFTNEDYVSFIRAKKKSRVFFFTEDAIRELLENDYTFLNNYLVFLTGRISYLNRKIRYLTAGSAERKLALYLSSFESETVELDASISSLSELLDIGRASLYRAADKLEADGFIKRDGKNLTLVSKEQMLIKYND